jgi:hypothetical protein
MPIEMQFDPDLAAVMDRIHRSPVEVCNNRARLKPIVKRTRDCLVAGAKKAGDSLIWAASREPILHVGVGGKSIDRAVRILDALVRGLELAGFTVNGPTVAGFGLTRVMRLREKTRQVPHKIQPGASELDLMLAPKYDYVPNGILGLELGNQFDAWSTHQSMWETKNSPLETRIVGVPARLLMEIQESRNRQAAKTNSERRRAEEQAIKRQKQERRDRRRKREAALFEAAEQWRRAETLRAFAQAVRQVATQEVGAADADQKIVRWLVWAGRVADRHDPLVRRRKSAPGRRRPEGESVRKEGPAEQSDQYVHG